MNSEFQPNNNQENAESEQELFNSGLYQEQQLAHQAESEQKEHSRKEEIKDELHNWVILFIKCLFGSAVLAGAIYFWHLVTPDYFTWNNCPLFKLHFLPSEKLDKLSAFFVTVVLSSTFTSYAKKYLE